ncbi:MAG: glycosyltransferase [Henriciella sp.]|nr:glycosyltransferase [Henriciella sp.]
MLIPMYDGCANNPPYLWSHLEQCSMISFSYNLHARTKEVITHQKLVQYFPNPAAYRKCDHSNGNRVFFWLRRPEDIDFEAVLRMVRGGFDRIHVHLSPDSGAQNISLPVEASSYNVTTSRWFKSKDEFDKLLDEFNVLVCPRLSEGIGMNMLDGLARGMCVIANRDATHTEYIADGINGYLFDHNNYEPLDLRMVQSLGDMARIGVEDGYRNWCEQKASITEFLEDCSVRPTKLEVPIESARLLVRQYFSDFSAYTEHAKHISEIKDADDTEESEKSLGLQSGPAALVSPALLNKIEFSHGDRAIDLVRARMNRVPGWRNIKSMVPLALKNRVANALAKRAE